MADLIILDASSAKIDGESTVKGFEKMIELLSFSQALSQQVTHDTSNTKRTSGKPHMHHFTVTKYQDLSSCKLIDFCLKASPIKDLKVIIAQNNNGKVTKLFTYEMKDALVASYSVGGGAHPAAHHAAHHAAPAAHPGAPPPPPPPNPPGEHNSDKPHETITFSFTKITWTYVQQGSEVKQGGSLPVTWDFTTNTGS
jgi:type VI secretion system secreted protein Hcp